MRDDGSLNQILTLLAIIFLMIALSNCSHTEPLEQFEEELCSFQVRYNVYCDSCYFEYDLTGRDAEYSGSETVVRQTVILEGVEIGYGGGLGYEMVLFDPPAQVTIFVNGDLFYQDSHLDSISYQSFRVDNYCK